MNHLIITGKLNLPIIKEDIMKITIGNPVPESGKTEVTVHLKETINGFGQSGKINVWVDYNDSLSKMYDDARNQVRGFLERALQAHSD
jgi:hypothetical protein